MVKVTKLSVEIPGPATADHRGNDICENGGNKIVKKEEKSLDEDDVCPEGGWGYVVCLGLATVFTIGIAPMSSKGILYEDFLMSIGDVTNGLTIAFGLGNAMLAFAGMMTTCALKKFSLRQIGLFGSALYVAASFWTIFVNSMPAFVFVNGVLRPVGFGIIMPISLTCFNTYFHKKRALMMSIVSVVVGAASMVFPILIENMMQKYGFRGTLAILCAINLHIIPSIAIMRPVEWSRKRVLKETKSPNTNATAVRIGTPSPSENYTDGIIGRADEPLLSGPNVIQIVSQSRSGSPEADGFCKEDLDNKFLNKPKVEDLRARMLVKKPSIASIGNRAGTSMITEALQTDGPWNKLINLLDLTLFKDPIYCNLCFGITLSLFADMTFFTLEPSILTSLGYQKTQIAYCVSIGAFADLISRIIFAVASFYFKLKSRIVFFTGNIFMIVFRIVFLQWTDLTFLMAVTGCLGFFRHWILMSTPLVFVDQYGIEKFPAAYGLYMLISGVCNLILGPLTGLIKDIFSDFNIVVGYLIVCSLLCAVPWSIEFTFHKRRTAKR